MSEFPINHPGPERGDDHHDKWEHFSAEEKAALMHEDSDAWNAVTKILLTIVAIGLTLSVITLMGLASRDSQTPPQTPSAAVRH